jgi:1-acyl-sn-glycerol-3-phosphate acyltransferase
MLLLRSLLFHAVMVISILVYAPLVMLLFWLPYRTRYRFATLWGYFIIAAAHLLCGIRYRVEGRENLPDGAIIILSKHQSTWETFAYPRLFHFPQVWVLKRELMWIPFFGWGLATLAPIAINRGAGRQAVRQIIDQGRKRLESGKSVVLFPEGTRVPSGYRRRYGLGGGVLAAETGYPVVPVAHNAGLVWPRRGFVLHPGTVTVAVGPVIDPAGKSAEEIRDAAEQWIETTMMRLENRQEMAPLLLSRHPGRSTGK